MRRQWRIDNSQPVGYKYVWKGNPNKLPAPWIVIDGEFVSYYGKNFSLEKGYHYIKKCSNLEWLEHVLTRRDKAAS